MYTNHKTPIGTLDNGNSNFRKVLRGIKINAAKDLRGGLFFTVVLFFAISFIDCRGVLSRNSVHTKTKCVSVYEALAIVKHVKF